MERSSSVSHWLSEVRGRTLEAQLTDTDLACTHLTHSPPVTIAMEANIRLLLSRGLRQTGCPVTPALHPNKCWREQL